MNESHAQVRHDGLSFRVKLFYLLPACVVLIKLCSVMHTGALQAMLTSHGFERCLSLGTEQHPHSERRECVGGRECVRT